ncbi:restriction endonuclease subunit S [Paenibacillus sp. CMAA1739]|uniref:restriction endonuclease subunit S n=1 Tax=Paenibacillus ottowii TaxID=2315729 RepID=UPI00272F5360|nr:MULTISPECIES: restriction endonuclease subunit S [Paenibacillus]MDP1512157.1 restriction endonuclease subunit S [Paenibacillus ottowii]MEC4567739.1 restriction endonuclease subunit S [Paenibacillus sp. CMAA1739]
MSKIEFQKIKDVATVYSGTTPDTKNSENFLGDINWYTPAEINGIKPEYVYHSERKITEEARSKKSIPLLPKNTILLTSRAPIGKVAIAGSEFCTNQGFKNIVCDENKVFPKYLAYWLSDKTEYLNSLGRGATFKEISKKIVEEIKVPIPSIEVQKQAAIVLENLNNIIEKRQSQITALDELTQSLFLEMFGDPIQNIKKFKQMPIKNVISDIQTGWSPVASKEPATNNEPGVLKLSAVTGGRYNFKENKKLLDGTPFKSEYEVNVGDILLTRKNTKELVGACSYIFETSSKLMFSDLIFKLIIKNITLIEPIYLWRLLNNNSMKKELSKLASGSSGSMPNISKKNLNELLIVVPPIELQKEFVNKIISLEKIRNDFINSLSSYEILYNSLLQKAFKGELFQEQ